MRAEPRTEPRTEPGTDARSEACAAHQSCPTCADEAVPATVKRLLPHRMAIVDLRPDESQTERRAEQRAEQEISVALVEARVGDTVLVHAGEAIALATPDSPEAPAAPAGAAPAGDATMASLYPFLYPATHQSTGDQITGDQITGDQPAANRDAALSAVLAEARKSTVAKAREIATLRHTILDRDGGRIAACARRMAAAFAAGGRLFGFGNGGSATDAADLVSLFVDPGAGRRPLPAYLLTGEVAVVTALSNDVGFEVATARQLAAFARPGDLAIGLSTSGNSENLIAAFAQASRQGLLTIGLSGSSGGTMATLDSLDHHFIVPSTSVHRIQEAQTTIYHVLWELTLAALDELTTGREVTRTGPLALGDRTAREEP